MKSEWPTVKLGEIVFEERLPVGTFDGNGLPVLGVTNVDGVTHTGVTASEDLSKYLRLKPGRFVYNPYRINVGSLGLSSETQDGITSPAYVVFAPGERVEAKFLHYYLKSARGSQLINFYGNRGTVRSALRFNDLCQIEITLPPLAEQLRIVARIEELAAQINEARTLRQKAAEETNALLFNQVDRIFKNLAGLFPLRVFGSFSPHVTSGPRNWAKHYVEGGFRFYRAQDIGPSGTVLEDSKVFIMPPPGEQGQSARLQSGDLMLVITGATVGRANIFRDDLEPGFVSQHVAICRLPSDQINPEYVLWGLQGPEGKSQLLRQRYGQGKPGLNLSNIRALKVPFPPLFEQHKIVMELDALQAEVSALKRLQAETAAELDALLPSILDRAFKGEL